MGTMMKGLRNVNDSPHHTISHDPMRVCVTEKSSSPDQGIVTPNPNNLNWISPAIGSLIIAVKKAHFLMDWVNSQFPHHHLVEVKVFLMQAQVSRNP
jgi:hypothetical protein